MADSRGRRWAKAVLGVPAGGRRHTLPREALGLERWLCSSPSGCIAVVVLVTRAPAAFAHRTAPASTLAAAGFPAFVHRFLSRVGRARNGKEPPLPVIKSLTLLIHSATRGTGSTRYLQDSISGKQWAGTLRLFGGRSLGDVVGRGRGHVGRLPGSVDVSGSARPCTHVHVQSVPPTNRKGLEPATVPPSIMMQWRRARPLRPLQTAHH